MNVTVLQLQIPSCVKKFVLWQEISSCKRKCLSVAWNFVYWDENSFCERICLPLTGNFFLWQEISSCDRKFLPVTGNVFLLQEISSKDRKFLSATKILTNNLFLRKKHYSGGRSFLEYFIPSDVKKMCKTHLCRNFEIWWKITHICRDFISDLFLLFRANLFSGKLGSHKISNFHPPWSI